MIEKSSNKKESGEGAPLVDTMLDSRWRGWLEVKDYTQQAETIEGLFFRGD